MIFDVGPGVVAVALCLVAAVGVHHLGEVLYLLVVEKTHAVTCTEVKSIEIVREGEDDHVS